MDAQATLVRNDQQALNTANSNVSAARAAVQANGSISGSGLQASAVQQSAAQEKVALAQAQQVRVQISKAAIVSPIDGVVVNRNINPGEYPGSRQIFTLQQVNPIYARAARIERSRSRALPTGRRRPWMQPILADSASTGASPESSIRSIPARPTFKSRCCSTTPASACARAWSCRHRLRRFRCAACAIPVSAFTDDNHDAVMVVQSGDTIKTMKVAEVGSDGTTSIVTGLAKWDAARQQRPDEPGRRRKGFVPAVNFSLTRLFINRPTLVFVIVSLMLFAGILSLMTIVKELYPNVSQPTVSISVGYNGASVTEMRDNIVQPIEQNLAGTPDLQTFNSVVQQGQAQITAIFDINSDTATDLALTNKAIQAAEKYLPTNISPPTVNLRDPTQSVVVTLALYSKKLSLSQTGAVRDQRDRAADRASSRHLLR